MTWRLEARPIRLTTFGATAGYRARIPVASSVDLTWNAGFTAEALLLSRSDLDGAATHRAYDAGGVGGLGASYRPFGGLSLALFAEGIAVFTAQQVQIPGGPAARMNRWGVRAGAQVALVFDEISRVEDQNR